MYTRTHTHIHTCDHFAGWYKTPKEALNTHASLEGEKTPFRARKGTCQLKHDYICIHKPRGGANGPMVFHPSSFLGMQGWCMLSYHQEAYCQSKALRTPGEPGRDFPRAAR